MLPYPPIVYYYCASKKLSALLRRITWKYVGDFYYLNCLHSSIKKGNLNLNESMNKVIDACKTNFWKIIYSKYSLTYSLWGFYDMRIWWYRK